MREYRVIDAWRPRSKNAANGSILSGGTVLITVVSPLNAGDQVDPKKNIKKPLDKCTAV